jgi:hypothetical protein
MRGLSAIHRGLENESAALLRERHAQREWTKRTIIETYGARRPPSWPTIEIGVGQVSHWRDNNSSDRLSTVEATTCFRYLG